MNIQVKAKNSNNEKNNTDGDVNNHKSIDSNKNSKNVNNRNRKIGSINVNENIEKYIKSGDNVLLQDFKVHCFNGSPKFVQTISDREGDLKENWHTPSWEPLDISYFSGKKASVERPVILEEMLEKAIKQSNGAKEALKKLGFGDDCGICLLDHPAIKQAAKNQSKK